MTELPPSGATSHSVWWEVGTAVAAAAGHSINAPIHTASVGRALEALPPSPHAPCTDIHVGMALNMCYIPT